MAWVKYGHEMLQWAFLDKVTQLAYACSKLAITIHLLSQQLLIQIHRWKHQKNTSNLLKVNDKDTSLFHWGRSVVFIVNLNVNIFHTLP